MKAEITGCKIGKCIRLTESISKWLGQKFGGKWCYDYHGSWWCDDNLRHVSRYSDLDECENIVGPPRYCLYTPDKTKWVYPE